MGLIERLRAIPDRHGMMYDDYDDVMTAADALEKLRGYAVHDISCDAYWPEGGGSIECPCTCGLSALLKELGDEP